MSADYAWSSLLSCIREGENELEDIVSCSGLGGLVKGLVARLEDGGLVRVSGGTLTLGEGGKLRMALVAAADGVDLRSLSSSLGWRDFEGFTAKLLEEYGFSVRRNFRISRIAEIDVIGIEAGFAVAIDCKHWRYYSRSALEEAARRQRRRVELLFERSLDESLGFSEALPAVVTLYDPGPVDLGYSCIVAISSLSDFLRVARGIEICRELVVHSRR